MTSIPKSVSSSSLYNTTNSTSSNNNTNSPSPPRSHYYSPPPHSPINNSYSSSSISSPIGGSIGSSSEGGQLKRSSSQLFEQNNYEPFIFAQSLTSVCLDPTVQIQNDWTPSELLVPPPQQSSAPIINLQSFQNYLNLISSNKNKELIPSNKKTPEEIISLENIPAFFFTKNLTKDAMLDYANSDPSPILFQKLEHYSSIIEENIVGHIREKSKDFFVAMSQLKQFHSEVNEITEEINNSILKLQLLDKEVLKTLNISRLRLQKNRIRDSLELLTMISEVKQVQPAIQMLLSKGDYMGALDLIETTKKLLENNLSGISALKNLLPQLTEMTNLIEKMTSEDFIKITLSDDIIFQDDQDGTKSSNDNTTNSAIALAENIGNLLIPFIIVLIRIGKIPEVLESLRETSINSIKSLFRNIVATVTYEIEQGKGIPYNSKTFNWKECKMKMMKLSPTDSLTLFKEVDKAFRKKYIIISKIVNLVQMELSRRDSSIKINNNPASPPTPTSPPMINLASYSDKVNNCCSNLIYSVTETMQDRISTLLKDRGEVNAKLALPDFVNLYNTIYSFIVFSESNSVQSKKKSFVLRSSLITQSKLFLDTLHKNRLSSLSLLLENEEWVQVKVVSEFQDIVDHIVNLSLQPTSPPESRKSTTTTNNTEIIDPLQQNSSNENINNNNNNDTSTTSTTTTTNTIGIADEITISGEPFKVINTLLMLIKFTKDYLTCIENLPSLLIDSLPKFNEILHTFNVMTYQSILGAGARQQMKLKTITSKHLAITSQCLSFVIKFIPYLKTVLQGQLNVKQQSLLNGFDKLLQDIVVHRSEIFDKFVQILKERTIHHLKVMGTFDLKDDSIPIPTPPLAGLLKDISTLHKLLYGVLPSEQLFKIFGQLFNMLNSTMAEQIQRFDLGHKNSRRRIHNDILHLMGSIRKLPCVGEPGTEIEDFLRKNYPI
eukprot:gene7405-9100_t